MILRSFLPHSECIEYFTKCHGKERDPFETVMAIRMFKMYTGTCIPERVDWTSLMLVLSPGHQQDFFNLFGQLTLRFESDLCVQVISAEYDTTDYMLKVLDCLGKINWRSVSTFHRLDCNTLNTFQDKLDFGLVTSRSDVLVPYRLLSKFRNDVNWYNMSKRTDNAVYFYDNFYNLVDWEAVVHFASPSEFLIEHCYTRGYFGKEVISDYVSLHCAGIYRTHSLKSITTF